MFDKNYEIKSAISDISKIKKFLHKDKSYSFTKETQVDIYYRVKKGRLKLRIINNKYSHLIYYKRQEKRKIRTSNYIISQTEEFKQLDRILRSQFQIFTEVKKQRDIFIKGNIRIHLDKVKSLGDFLEIEIIYKDLQLAKKQMNKLISDLNLNKINFIKKSYSDMLINKKYVITEKRNRASHHDQSPLRDEAAKRKNSNAYCI